MRGAAEPKVPNEATLLAVLASAERNHAHLAREDQTRSRQSHVLYRLFVRSSAGYRVVQFVRLAALRAQEDADLDSYAAADRDVRRREVAADNAEAARVSQGITQLATVISAVRSKAVHIPWRSTKLTYVLPHFRTVWKR